MARSIPWPTIEYIYLRTLQNWEYVKTAAKAVKVVIGEVLKKPNNEDKTKEVEEIPKVQESEAQSQEEFTPTGLLCALKGNYRPHTVQRKWKRVREPRVVSEVSFTPLVMCIMLALILAGLAGVAKAEGCDASLFFDAIDGEKEASPNESLKGFDIIDLIKAKVEEQCPGFVNCADVLVLNDGPFYPLITGRRDSTLSFPEVAQYELPSPQDDLPTVLASFATRGFDKGEAAALLGAHGMGVFHCMFFFNRLYSFNKAENFNPSKTQYLNLMRSTCDPSNNRLSVLIPHSSTSPSPSPSSHTVPPVSSSYDQSEMKMDYKAPSPSFVTVYTHEQLKPEEEIADWIKTYTSNTGLFHQDFALAMIKISNMSVLTAPLGQVRSDCVRVVA